jgi:3-oxoacyl-[acyl-carrier protein] reductase
VRAIEDDGGRALAIQSDAGDPASVRAAVNETVAAFGSLSILVNNAGISRGDYIERITFADYERMVSVNVTGVFVATQEAVRHMKPGSRVIHIGSAATRHAALAGCSLYTLTKAAVAGFSRALARDLGPRGITVNTVHPGPTDTDMNPDGSPVSELVRPAIAIGRYGRAMEIASVVAYLARPESAFVTGAEILADGGFTA